MKKRNFAAAVCALTALVLSGCVQGLPVKDNRSDDEIVSDFLKAYQENDYESMKPYFDEDNLLEFYFQGQEDGGGMGEVYKKVWELTKDFTFTAEAVEGKEAWGEVTVHLQSHEITSGIPDAMWAALEAQAENGDDSFADLPGWLSAALKTGAPVDEEITVYVSHRSDGDRIDSQTCREFYRQLTGGFYDYIDMTMTTCTAGSDVYQIASQGDSIVGMLQSVQMEGAEDASEEDIQAYESQFDLMDGVIARIRPTDDGNLQMRFGVDFNQASSTALANLGVISDRITSSGGYLSLYSTISGFEESGMTCVTDDFGSGAAASE